MANCHDLFSAFHDAIALSPSDRERLRKARDALRTRITAAFREAGRTPVPEFRQQGSYAMGTIVRPIEGEFDLDDGVYLQHLDNTDDRNWPTPETVHGWVVDAVKGHTKDKPIDKRTCIRVTYAGDYHVDLPIYAVLSGELRHAEKGQRGWHASDPEALTKWFVDAVGTHGEQLRRMVRYFKAWADYSSRRGKLPGGLVFTVLVNESFSAHERDDVCFGRLATALYAQMLVSPQVLNPCDPSEDLCDQYDEAQHCHFVESLRCLSDASAEALSAKSKMDACCKWREEFGERWTDCDTLAREDSAKYTTAPAILRDDARSAE